MNDRDEYLLDLYFKRDERAVAETQREYGSFCMDLALRILGRNNREDAEECVNDTYLRAWNSIPPTRPHSLKLFLARITRNLSINRHRALHSDKRNKDLEVSLSELEPCFPSPDDLNGSGGELVELLNEFLEKQPKTDRVIFVQRYWYSLPTAQIAEEQGMSENAVWVKLHRTRERVRVYLTERGYKL